MIEFGYAGRIFLVKPTYRELRRLACCPSVRELPEAPDQVGIVVPTERVFGALEDYAACAASRNGMDQYLQAIFDIHAVR